MAAVVTKLELITGEGKILTLTAQNNKDIFNAAQVCCVCKCEERERKLKMKSPCINMKILIHYMCLHQTSCIVLENVH